MLTPRVVGLLLAVLPTQQWQEGSNEPGFLPNLAVPNLHVIPRENRAQAMRACSPAGPVLRVRGSPRRVC